MQSKRGTFIISFDCEGKWGMADKINEHHERMLTNDQLNETYQRLVALLDSYRIKATFAFVGAFVMSPDEFHAHSDWFQDVQIGDRIWLERFRHDIARGCRDGWLNPESLAIVRASPRHEIGSHGFTHLPLGESAITRNEFLNEMAGIRRVAELKNVPFKTLIYPRNDVGYPNDLAAGGIVGYREFLFKQHPKFAGARNILREFNLLQRSQVYGHSGGVVRIPSGYFLNWRTGLRRKIPVAVSVQRWSNLIDDADHRGGVVHLWSHPWNFLNGHDQFSLFEQLLERAARAIDAGKIDNLTQLEFCTKLGTAVEATRTQQAAA